MKDELFETISLKCSPSALIKNSHNYSHIISLISKSKKVQQPMDESTGQESFGKENKKAKQKSRQALHECPAGASNPYFKINTYLFNKVVNY